MKMKQIIYPNFNSVITLTNVTYVQIGIEYPYAFPILENKEEELYKGLDPVLEINDIEYTISENSILEFSDIAFNNLVIKPKFNNIPEEKLKYLIIDLAYQFAD
jgi:hypothetical protein